MGVKFYKFMFVELSSYSGYLLLLWKYLISQQNVSLHNNYVKPDGFKIFQKSDLFRKCLKMFPLVANCRIWIRKQIGVVFVN